MPSTRLLVAAVVIALAAPAARPSEVRFVSPQNGSQTVGTVALEVETAAPAIDRVEFFIDGALVGVARQPPFRVFHDFGTSLQSHRIVAHVRSDHFRRDDTAEVLTAALSAGESLSVDLVEMPLKIKATRRVTAADLQVMENGVSQSIRELRSDRPPARFVFIVDRSLSMGGGRLVSALEAVDVATSMLRPDDTAQIVMFNHNVSQPRTIPRGSGVSAVLGEVGPSGGTSLRDAVASIAGTRRTWAIVVTDGGDRNSELSEARALEKISGASIVIDALVLGSASTFLRAAARNTGGTIVSADRRDIGERMRNLIDEINSRYTLSYQSHGTAPGWRRVEVLPRSRSVAVANARKEYFAE